VKTAVVSPFTLSLSHCVFLKKGIIRKKMGRKSKQVGGHFPLTHYERTKKFASSEYGTVQKRLAGHSQYQLGQCALTTTQLPEDGDDDVLCGSSGYLYRKSAILEYLLTKTQELKRQREAYERQQLEKAAAEDVTEEKEKERKDGFLEAQRVVKKRKREDEKVSAKADLKRTSYWLAEAQPASVKVEQIEEPPERPPSPVTGRPLRRKDLWPVSVKWDDDRKRVVCAVSGKTVKASNEVTAYWTDKKEPGTIVLKTVYDELVGDTKRCPVTSKKIKCVRQLQQSGSSFASSGQNVEVKKYRPTIT
jgi:nitric oxide synthase-interacting protein